MFFNCRTMDRSLNDGPNVSPDEKLSSVGWCLMLVFGENPPCKLNNFVQQQNLGQRFDASKMHSSTAVA